MGAYNGAGPGLIQSNELLTAAGSIVQVEARHAAYVRLLREQPAAAEAFDEALERDAVQPFTASRRPPGGGGAPPPSPGRFGARRSGEPGAMDGAGVAEVRADGKLSWAQRRALGLLGLPSFGLALAATVVTTYLPVLLAELAGPTVIGALIGIEGALAIFLPLVIGSWSDRVDTRFGRRMPFLLVATPLAVAALIFMPLVGSLLAVAVLLFCFYVAYFTYYAPYRALYPDLVGDDLRGRSQSFQATWREAGLGLALVGGGVLIGIWQPLPFLIAAVVLSAVTVAFFLGVQEPAPAEDAGDGEQALRGTFARVWQLVREQPDLRRLLVANALWELTLAALKTFAVLYITVGLGRSTGFASGVLALVAVAVLLAAVLAGRLADRLGHLRVVRMTLWLYGLGPLLFLFTSSLWVVPAAFAIAFAAGILLSLPYSLMMGLMPSGSHGAAAGLYGFSRGAGLVLGPLIAGVAIELAEPVFETTGGYAAVFGVVAAAILLSIPLVRGIDSETIEEAA